MTDDAKFHEKIHLTDEICRLNEENAQLRAAANSAWQLAERLNVQVERARGVSVGVIVEPSGQTRPLTRVLTFESALGLAARAKVGHWN